MIYLSMAGLAVVSFQVRSLSSPSSSGVRSLPLNLVDFHSFADSTSLPSLAQWFFWGYSLAFSETGSAFIGDLRYFALRNVYEAPSMGSTKIPASLFMICE